MKVLVTGCAGFIGFHLSKKLLKEGHTVVGVDIINDYYSPQLKIDRLKELGLDEDVNKLSKTDFQSSQTEEFKFFKIDLEDKENLSRIFKSEKFDSVCNLGAQAGVRYSITNPDIYMKSNILGFYNILECCRLYEIDHLCFASSSSVYGLSADLPYSVDKCADHPVSLYAATKRSNELLAHSYAHLYSVPITGLRFFTVYGPWGRPDMAYFKFTKALFEGEEVELYNDGNSLRDFTFIDDAVDGTFNALIKPSTPNSDWDPRNPNISSSSAPYEVFNIGNDKPVTVSEMKSILEMLTGKKLKIRLLPLQQGDVNSTHADILKSKENLDFSPSTTLKSGLSKFVEWYCRYYEIT